MIARDTRIKLKFIPKEQRIGKILYDSPHKREPHEIETAKNLVKFGENVTFIMARNVKGVDTADILWRKEFWEIKSPTKNKSETIVNAVKSAAKQSKNIIIDLSRNRRSVRQATNDIQNYIRKYRAFKISKIIVMNKTTYCYFKRSMIL